MSRRRWLCTGALAAIVLAVLLGLPDPSWLGGVHDDGDHEDLALAPAWDERPAPPVFAMVPGPGASLLPPRVLRITAARAPPA